MPELQKVEVVQLGRFDEEQNCRDFDAISYGAHYWRGLIRYERWRELGQERIYVFSDREDPLGDDYAMSYGNIETVRDDQLAISAISKAITRCFDHTTTVEAISDGSGGWITLETDT